MNQATISVIIPVYNSENTIEAVLDSVRQQTRFDYIKEIIVIDDGSIDKSIEVIQGYAEKNPEMPLIICSKENGGASTARNYGMRIATAKYIAFLDSDDLWMPNKIERQMETINEQPSIRFLGTAWYDKPLQIGFKKITELYNGTVKDICIKNFPVTPSVIMERSLLEEIGYYNENMKYAEDINYFQKFAAAGNFYFLPEKLVQIDIQKKCFGEKGLTSHLKEMHEGTLINIKELQANGDISTSFWFVMRVFYELKYWRRIIKRSILLRNWREGKKSE